MKVFHPSVNILIHLAFYLGLSLSLLEIGLQLYNFISFYVHFILNQEHFLLNWILKINWGIDDG